MSLICEDRGRAMKAGCRYLLVNLYQIIPNVWLWYMVVRHILSSDVHSCIQFERAARGSQIFSNMADILTEAMQLYSTGGLTCYSRIRGNYLFIVN